MVQGLYDLCEVVCRNYYNQQQSINRLKERNQKYKDLLCKYDVYGLIDFNDENISDAMPVSGISDTLSKSQTNKKIAKVIKLILSMDASLSVAQQFVIKLIKRLMKKNTTLHSSIKDYIFTHVIRDLNQLIQNFKYDENRMTSEAFNYKSNNISTRKAQQTRNAVE